MRKIPFGRPIIGEQEKEAVNDVLSGSVLVHGPRTERFERDFAHWTASPHAIGLSSCTAGLHLLYFDLGIGPGDEVIVPAQTHTATAHAVEFTGATPVFVDCELESGNIDIERIETAITPRTKALSVVHYLGVPVAMDKICAIAARHNLAVVEDCALALGATFKGRHVGLWGDAGCFSFYPVKHITTAEGGMIITRHDELAQRMRRKRAFGVDRHAGERSVPGVYDVTMLGFNYRMNEIEAALGAEQLRRMDGFLDRRRQNYNHLYRALSRIDALGLFQPPDDDCVSSHYCLAVLLRGDIRSKRTAIIEQLNRQGVGTSIYYPQPVPHLTYYREKYGFTPETFPNAAAVSSGSIALPVGPHLDREDMDYIAHVMQKTINEVAG